MYVSSHKKKKKNNSEKTPELFLICIHVLLFFLTANVNITLLPLYRHTNNIQCVKFDYTFNKYTHFWNSEKNKTFNKNLP